MHGRYCRWQHALVDVCSIHLNSTVNTHTHTHDLQQQQQQQQLQWRADSSTCRLFMKTNAIGAFHASALRLTDQHYDVAVRGTYRGRVLMLWGWYQRWGPKMFAVTTMATPSHRKQKLKLCCLALSCSFFITERTVVVPYVYTHYKIR